jgi:uncharacterized membrane protein
VDPGRQRDTGRDPDRREDSQVAEQVTIQADRVEVSQAWSGPLPPPDILAEYETVLPGSAERILCMAEKAATGMIDNARAVAEAEIEGSKRGLSFAMWLTGVMVAVSAAFFAAAVSGSGDVAAAITAGSVFLSVPVIMLIRSFITRS